MVIGPTDCANFFEYFSGTHFVLLHAGDPIHIRCLGARSFFESGGNRTHASLLHPVIPQHSREPERVEVAPASGVRCLSAPLFLVPGRWQTRRPHRAPSPKAAVEHAALQTLRAAGDSGHHARLVNPVTAPRQRAAELSGRARDEPRPTFAMIPCAGLHAAYLTDVRPPQQKARRPCGRRAW